jgi:hypothetical protein
MEKSSQKFPATSVIFKKLPKVNNHPKGENLPNLLTLLSTIGFFQTNQLTRQKCPPFTTSAKFLKLEWSVLAKLSPPTGADGPGLPDFSWYNIPKREETYHKIYIPNGHKIYQIRPNGHKMYQHLPLQDPPKFTQIGIFGLKICMPSGNPGRVFILARTFSPVLFTFPTKKRSKMQQGCQIFLVH